jgi:phthalate 4,5-dioxygenase
MDQARNIRLTQVGAGTPGGAVMRQFWQPVALVEEFDPSVNAATNTRPMKAVRVLGQDFVLFKDVKKDTDAFALLDRHCAHRGADLAFARFETDGEIVGIRCPFHGWKYAGDGTCIETPAEPTGSTLCQRVRQGSYPTTVRAGVVFAWLGKGAAPASHLKAYGNAIGYKHLKSALTLHIRRFCIAFCMTSI